MRWYCVLCLRASVLKKSTLRLLNAMVTLTPSSLKTRSSGRGRKSGTAFCFESILLRPALDGDDAELGVFVAGLAVLLVLLRGMPGLGLLHALPLLDGDAFRRRAFEHGAVARGEQLAAFLLDQRLRPRRVLLHVRVVVADVDLGDGVDRRLCLRVQRVNAEASEPEACDDGQRDAGMSLHSLPFAVWCCGLSKRVLLQESAGHHSPDR